MAPWTPPAEAALRLQAQIEHAAATSARSLTVLPGSYAFNSAPLNLTASGLDILAAGVHLTFSTGSGVVIRGSRDVRLFGPLSIDYTTPSYSQATITAVGDNCFATASPPRVCLLDVETHTGFPGPEPCFFPACESKLIFFDGDTGLMRRPQVVSWLTNATRLPGAAGRYRLATKLWAHNVVVGDVVAAAVRGCGPSVRGPCTLQLLHSERVSTSDVSVHAACNMAVYELGGGGNHSHVRLSITRSRPRASRAAAVAPRQNVAAPTAGGPYRDGSTRLLASNFDGLHSEGTLLGPRLSDSVIEHVGDDFFNVQNSIDVVLGWDVPASGAAGAGGDRRVVVADASFGSTFPAQPNATVGFFLPSRALWPARPLWSATVCNATLLQGTAAAPWRPLLSNISVEFDARYGWPLASFASKGFDVWALTLCAQADAPPPQLGYATFAQVNSSFGASLLRNRFSDGLGRVGPLLSSSSRVVGNVFNGTMLGGLLLSAEVTWLSGNLGLKDISVRDNIFVDCCSYRQIDYGGGQCSPSGYPVWAPAGVAGLDLANNTVLPAEASSYRRRALRAWSFWSRGRRERTPPPPPPPPPPPESGDTAVSDGQGGTQFDSFGCPVGRGSHSCDV